MMSSCNSFGNRFHIFWILKFRLYPNCTSFHLMHNLSFTQQNTNILKLFQDRTVEVWNAWCVLFWDCRLQFCSCSTLWHCLGFGLVFSAGSTVWPFLDCVNVLAADTACIQAQLVEERERKAAEMSTSVAIVQWVL
jgi:hypothetical protein